MGAALSRMQPSQSDLGARLGFVLISLAVTWIGDEYPRNGLPNFWYAREIMGIPAQYPAFAGLALLLCPFLLGRPHVSAPGRLRAHRMWGWTIAIWATLMLTILFAILGQAPEPFADWRNVIIFAIAAAFGLRWLTRRSWAGEAILDLAIGYGFISVIVLIRWLLGSGVRLFDQLTPLFYWPALFMMLFAAFVCTAAWLAGLGGLSRFRATSVIVSVVGSWLVVLLSFRRSFWLAGVVGASILFYDAIRRRQVSGARALAVLAVALVVGIAGFVTLGSESVMARLSSFLPGSETAYSQTNEDHVNDILEAFKQVAREPLTGLGVGQYYDTPLLAGWKERSFEVHNVFLQVWLKFGLLGLLSFTGFHFAWARAARRVQTGTSVTDATHRAVGAFIAAEFAGTMIQTWVYGRFQMCLLMGILLACLLVLPRSYADVVTTRKMSAAITGGNGVASN